MRDVASNDPLIAANTPDEMLRALRPHIRRVVEVADPAFLPAFDAAYDDGTADALDEHLSGPSSFDELSGEQALGLRKLAAAALLPFMLNVAASIAVARFQTEDPKAWAWLAGLPTTAEVPKNIDAAEGLLAKCTLTMDQRARAVEHLRSDKALAHVLALTYRS